MKSYFALIAVGLDAAASRILKSKFEKMAAAVVVGVVGIGLLASPFLVLANDEETNDAPEVLQLYVLNFGSIGFKVKFDVRAPSDSDKLLNGFELWQDGLFVDDELWVKSASLISDFCDWLEIPGFDGGPPLPYPGYSHSFDFIIKGLEFEGIFPYGGPPPHDLVSSVASSVSVQLYVEVDSEGALESMSAWAVDSDGDSYEVSVYYSAGGGWKDGGYNGGWDGSFNPF